MSETFIPASTASATADVTRPFSSVNRAKASRSSDSMASASVWAASNSLRVMPELTLAACALLPSQRSPTETLWTSFSYTSSSDLNCVAMDFQPSAAVVSAERSVFMIS
ncbi:hypothetical protein WKI68_28730 [Streptomyces sp. MS1.HAVA.3]|uniref:Uncharacterized protein n=1 Tax=Streptomyces caledonius TaxID=3134107 RepID=A0ABU8UAB0_9ACTN